MQDLSFAVPQTQTQTQPQQSDMATFSWEGMALDMAITAGLRGGYGLFTGGPLGAGIGAIEGAIEGALGYLAGTAAAKIAYALGADKNTQFAVGLVTSIAVPGSSITKARDFVSKFPKLAKEGLKTAWTSAMTGYIAWSLSDDDDPRFAFTLGAIAGAGLHGLTVAYDMPKLLDNLAARATSFSSKIPGLSLLKEIPEVFAAPQAWEEVAGLPKRLTKTVPIGLRDVVKEGLRVGIAKQWEAQYVLKMAEKAGMKAYAKDLQAITNDLKYGMSIKAYEEFKKANPGVGEFLDKYVDIVTTDTAFMQASGMIDGDILSAFTYIRKDLDKMKVHIPVVMRMEKEAEEMRFLFKKPRPKLIKEQAILKEAGRQMKITDKVLKKLGVDSVGDLTPGQQVLLNGHEWTVIRKGKEKRLLRQFTPEEYKKITAEKVKQGTVPPGTVVQPDLIAGAIKLASERGQLYKRAWIVNKAEALLRKHGLLADKATDALTYKIPDLKLKDSWGIRAFGRMNGLYTTPEVAKALENINALLDYSPGNFAENLLGEFSKKWAFGTNLWKKFFLGANWKSYMTQGLGNIALCLVNDINPAKVVRQGLNALRDRKFRLAFERLGGESIGVEHDIIVKGYKYTSGKLVPRTKAEAAVAALDMIGDRLIGWFGYTDKVFRAGLVKRFMDEGLSMSEALTKATEILPSYEMIPAGIKSLRDTIFPFISFSYVTLPRVAKAFFTKPHAFLTLLAFTEAIQVAAFREMYGANWREGRRFEKLVNEHYMQPMPGGMLADYVRVPRIGKIPGGYMSVSWMPWNLPVSIPAVTEASRPTFWGATFFLQHPLLKTVFGLTMNLDPATGRTVFDQAGAGRTWASVSQWFLRNVMPTPLGTGKYALHSLARLGWVRPLTSWFNCFGADFAGKPYELEHLLWNQIMPTIKRFDPTYKARMEIAQIQRSIEEHKRCLYKWYYRGIPKEELQKRQEEYLQFVEEQKAQALEIGSLASQLGY